MTATPDLSVVIPAYRVEATIARTLQSLQAEPGVALEIIVVVDGNLDGTAGIAQSFADVTVLRNDPQRGATFARNVGLAAATAPFVTFVDADDYIEGPYHREMLDALTQSDADMVVCQHVDEYPDPLMRIEPGNVAAFAPIASDRDRQVALVLAQGIITGGLGWRTERLRGIGGWNEKSRRSDDVEVVLRSLANGLSLSPALGVGRYVHIQDGNPYRISNRSAADSLPSVRLYCAIAEAVAAGSPVGDEIRLALARRCYRVAVVCFRERSDEAGEAILADARRLGLADDPGGFAHRLGCRLLGLRNKEHLARRLRPLRGKLGQKMVVRPAPLSDVP